MQVFDDVDQMFQIKDFWDPQADIWENYPVCLLELPWAFMFMKAKGINSSHVHEVFASSFCTCP